MPAALFTGLNVLLKKGLSDERSRESARKGLENLKNVRKSLLFKLEESLEQLDRWFQDGTIKNSSCKSDKQALDILLIGQNLSDELTVLENLETRINSLLNQVNTEN